MFRIVGPDEAACVALATSLIAGLTRRGLEVSVVARSGRARPVDRAGKDSHAHRAAGAQSVVVVSDARWAVVRDGGTGEAEPRLSQQLADLAPVDVVLVLGHDDGPGDVLTLDADGGVSHRGRRFAPEDHDDLCGRIARAV